jgi:hypothetical protein
MMRLGSKIVAIVLGVGLSASAVVAEQTRRLIAPMRGEATVELTSPDTRVVGSDVVTKIRVKNTSTLPIAGFKVDENWFKGKDALSGDSYRHARPLQVNEVIEITLTVPRSRVVGARNQYQFSHANGTIKPTPVKTLDLPKPDPAATKPPM